MPKSEPSQLYADQGLATFYDIGQPSREDFAYCKHLAKTADSVLDLGCGTGELAIALSHGRHVVGVDPAQGMLDMAMAKEGADRVQWVHADAHSVQLDTEFDLILLTGHTFQVFLDDQARLQCLRTIHNHLKPEGRFVFDSRNPAFPGSKERNKNQTLRTLEHLKLGTIEKWNQSSYDEERAILTYSNHYRVMETGEEKSATDQIAYTTQSHLARLIAEAGLTVEQWLGDWQGTPFQQDSKEIIPLGRKGR